MLSNSRNVALLIAASVAIITTSFLSLVPGVPLAAFLVVFILAFSSTYIITFFTVQYFIFAQIERINDRLSQLKSDDFSFVQADDSKPLPSNPLIKINEEIYYYAERKQREIEDLKKAETFRREFIADISHELKTPIFAAQGFVHTLLDGAVKDKNVRTRFLKKAAKSLDGLDRLVQDLLTISKMETGEVKVEFEHFNVYQLIADVYDQFESKAEKREMRMVFDASSRLDVYAYADRQKIYQVITNLVSNAIKYKKDGMGEVLAKINAENQSVTISIIDNGVGIPQEHISRIFERFYRVDKSRSKERGGTGLGLSIVKHIIELHHSHITVHSQPNVGSEFSFKLRAGAASLEGMKHPA
jgi:two-component system phosphate regulon sensor histidine kinase PhoR